MTNPASPEPYRVWGDGTVVNNGRAGAVIGFAYYVERGGRSLFTGGGWQAYSTASGKYVTNNIAEIQALMVPIALLYKTYGAREVHAISDSQYVLKGVSEWLWGWRRNGFRGYGGKDVLNRNLWEQFAWYTENMRISTEHVRGHRSHAMGGSFGNDLTDRLAALYRVQRVVRPEVLLQSDFGERYNEMFRSRSKRDRDSYLEEYFRSDILGVRP